VPNAAPAAESDTTRHKRLIRSRAPWRESYEPFFLTVGVNVFGTQNLALFVLTGALLNLTPGQDTFYIVGRSLAQGHRAGVLSVFGITSGCAVHTLAAAFGLSANLATSAHAFTEVRLTVAIYLGYLGARLIIDRSAAGELTELPVERSWTIYRAGVLTNVLNPKVALFFLAFLPQFVAADSPSKVMTFLFLGGLFMLTGTLWCLTLVWCASAMSRRLRDRPSSGVLLKRSAGILFIGLGARLAVNR
jgi:threonine/homoserine/homoserine lactone efflux protein